MKVNIIKPTAHNTPSAVMRVFGGLLTKLYIRVGLATGDSETRRKPALLLWRDRWQQV